MSNIKSELDILKEDVETILKISNEIKDGSLKSVLNLLDNRLDSIRYKILEKGVIDSLLTGAVKALSEKELVRPDPYQSIIYFMMTVNNVYQTKINQLTNELDSLKNHVNMRESK